MPAAACGGSSAKEVQVLDREARTAGGSPRVFNIALLRLELGSAQEKNVKQQACVWGEISGIFD